MLCHVHNSERLLEEAKSIFLKAQKRLEELNKWLTTKTIEQNNIGK